LAKRAKKDPAFVITCCHCYEDDYRLADVDKDKPVKYYTDTPFKMLCLSSAKKLKAPKHTQSEISI
jgi:hypothetical protein